jgi:cytochrome d ubiquinol oxidase subunit I
LGVLLYRRDRRPTPFKAFSALMVAVGSWLSGYFIVVTDAWMQHPVGYSIDQHGHMTLTDIWPVLFQPFAVWQYLHVMCGAMVAGGVLVAGIGALYLLSKRDEGLARRFVRAGTLVGFIFCMLAMFPTGDRNGADVTAAQPVKLAAMEGLFESAPGAPLAIIGMPDSSTRTLIDPIYVPSMLSFLAYGNFNANVDGLEKYARALWPPVELTYYAYHIMVGLGTIFAAVLGIATLLLLWGGRLYRAPAVLWVLMLLMPFPYIANEAGWTVSEVGRQPWIVYGVMRTADGSSPTVASGETLFTLIGFAGMYFLLGVLFLFLVLRQLDEGAT